MPATKIAIVGRSPTRFARLFDAIGEMYDVAVEYIKDSPRRPYDGVIFLDDHREGEVRAAAERACCLVVGDPSLGQPLDAVPYPVGKELCFSRRTTGLSPLFAGTNVSDPSIESIFPISLRHFDDVIARCGAEAIWVRRNESKFPVDIIGVPLRRLAECEYLYTHFTPANWFTLFCLLHFFYTVSGWTHPSPRACFMIDDPNLHWPSYGYVNFGEIVRDAAQWNYHMSFATVPLDAWFAHPSAAHLFRKHPNRISLLVHGNDHISHELAQDLSFAAQRSLADQAFLRVRRFERASNVTVAKVMAPPHGAYNLRISNALLHAGFEAACISRGSLMLHNPSVVWPFSVGLRPAEFLGHDLPLIPRISLTSHHSIGLRLRAFLGQPLVLVGHHHDLANDLAVLHRQAQEINAIANVDWMNLQSIVRTNHWTRQTGKTFELRLFSRSASVRIPQAVSHLTVDRPWLRSGQVEQLTMQKHGGVATQTVVHLPQLAVLPVQPQATVTISTTPAEAPSEGNHSKRSGIRLSPILRRCFCELRDRLKPTLDRAFGR